MLLPPFSSVSIPPGKENCHFAMHLPLSTSPRGAAHLERQLHQSAMP